MRARTPRATLRLDFIALAFACLLCIPAARADERILSYDSAITVQADGTLNVRETLRVQSEGNQIRRGIYRDFPTIYSGRNGEEFDVGFDFRSAQRDGSPEPWHSQTQDNGVRIYLGSKDMMLPPGEHTYEIEYHVDHELGFFQDHDELYWNVTGNGWDFPINAATARVILPESVPESEVNLEGYTGPQGAKGTSYNARMDHGVPFFETTGGLSGHEGLTIVVTWPKGFVKPPAGGHARRFNRRLLPAFFAVGGLAVLLTYYFWIWLRVGRDPPARIVIPEYEPPPNISPGGMRYLTRMRYDDQCFAADVLNLAVKGHLVVDEQRSGLFNRTHRFALIKQENADAKPLSAEEKALFTQIFATGPQVALDQENYQVVKPIKMLHRHMLGAHVSPGLFRANTGWLLIGVAWTAAMLVAVVLSAQRSGPMSPQLGFVIAGCMIIAIISSVLFGWLLKAPTVPGQAMLDHVRGFKKYLEVAEGEDLKRVTTPPPPLTPALYHAFLPAALALGVEQRWSERFARVFAAQPESANPAWYTGSSWDSRNVDSFSSNLGSAFSSAISSASTAPGSSSGSDGGGSSGGGGGGGGGGGW